MKTLVSFLLLSFIASRSFSQGGTLDNTFGHNGIVTTSFPISMVSCHASAIQNDGKIIAAGSYYTGSDWDFVALRYNCDGTLDNTFGNYGIAAAPVGPTDDYCFSAAIQADGKIILGGYTRIDGIFNFALLRFNSDGTVDNSFGGNSTVTTLVGSRNPFISVDSPFNEKSQMKAWIGSSGKYPFSEEILKEEKAGSLSLTSQIQFSKKNISNNTLNPDDGVITPVGNNHASGFSIALQSDGKIVAGGFSFNTWDMYTVIRYNPDGTLDAGFGTGGIVVTSFNKFAQGRSVLLQNDGKILLSGDSGTIRYNSDGTVDSTFGINGVLNSAGDKIAIQSDGKLLIAGSSVARYNTDGNLDSTFGSNGIASVYIGRATSILVQNDGNILISVNNWTLARLDTSGETDRTFGINGIVNTLINPISISLQNDGRIVAVGNSVNNVYSWPFEFVIVRHNTNGSIDGTFGINGKKNTPINISKGRVNCVKMQEDGKILALGWYHNGRDNDFAVVRYNQDGSLDTAFGSNGFGTTQIIVTEATNSSEYVKSMGIQEDGKIVVVGYAYEGLTVLQYMFLVRFNSDGTMDTTFGKYGGIQLENISMSDSRYGFYYSVEIQDDNKILVSGVNEEYHEELAGFYYDLFVYRYNQDGFRDQSFGEEGRFYAMEANWEDDMDYLTGLQPDGKIITGGFGGHLQGNYDFILFRCDSAGLLDTTFGSGGSVRTAIGTGDEKACAIAFQNDGKIVAGGYYWNGFDKDFALVRYNYDGTPDTAFGNDGIVTTQLGSSDNEIKSIIILPDGKIVAAGYASNGSDNDFTIVRYNSNGSIDTGFGFNGILMTRVGDSDDIINSIILHDGKLIAAGYSASEHNNSVLALIRYSLDVSTPVELSSFSASVSEDAERVILSWTTGSESNNKGFEIERKQETGDRRLDEGGWEKLGFVEGKGTTSEKQNYSFVDNNIISGEYSYRLKQVDYDGTFEYSQVLNISINSPLTFELSQNYPNPFNPNTIIKYTVKEEVRVTLKVYNILGSEVRTLTDEVRPAGRYEINFNAGDLSSGTYFYSIKAGSFFETRKMVLIK